MDTVASQPDANRLSRTLASFGPGIVTAACCVGGSHLVASTQAGAKYGWQLAILILLVNLFKYPFFRAAVQYTAGTGESLLQGYARMGKPYLYLFTLLCLVGAIVNSAALLLFSAHLLDYFVPGGLAIGWLATIVIAVCLLILFKGHYKALDAVSKIIMVVLSVSTVLAVVIAFAKTGGSSVVVPAEELPSAWQLSALGFLVVTMGWMPTTIDISAITSLWLKQQMSENDNITPQSALLDFNVGYIVTAVLAIVFLALGAMLLYGTGTQLATGGVGFTRQLVSLYTDTIGDWSRLMIATIAFFCIFGSMLTVLDGYGRVLAEAQSLMLTGKPAENDRTLGYWIMGIAAVSLGIVLLWTSALMPMLNFAMTVGFVAAPLVALLNYVLIRRSRLPQELQMTGALNLLSIAGLIYLAGFVALFIWWKWLM
ncbi:Nramp family divalent metal transporter [Oceanobacter mangrovi]|uniref:Nramp family divalent metal transporter n=1 Tax=Oceanobacter mangrovi TaxID=2862510 RepID=UPI001C8EB982|nr:Nramp family divalent metal transporter [Oceanobacter mangrovi]